MTDYPDDTSLCLSFIQHLYILTQFLDVRFESTWIFAKDISDDNDSLLHDIAYLSLNKIHQRSHTSIRTYVKFNRTTSNAPHSPPHEIHIDLTRILDQFR
jgi:hypothetical protein